MAPSFVVSFCEHKDAKLVRNGLLSQWRGYAAGGYCLVFNKDRLVELLNDDMKSSKDCSFACGPVDYHDEVGDDIVKPFNDIFEVLVPALLNKDTNADEKIAELYPQMLQLVPFVKDGGFSEEKEFRAVLQLMDIRRAIPDFSPTRELLHREMSGVIVPYIRLFTKRTDLPLERIVVGPSLNAERRAQGVRSLLASLMIEAEVTISEIPFTG